MMRRPTFATGAALMLALLVTAGAWVLYRPIATRHGALPAEIPAPNGLFSAQNFSVPGHGRACMKSVTVTPDSQLVHFTVFPSPRARHGGPPILLSLTGPSYRTTVLLGPGYPGGSASLPLARPPRRALIATACFFNRGNEPAALLGTDDPRGVSRSSPVLIDGRPQAGDISLGFYNDPAFGLRHRLSLVVDHASALTDGLLAPSLVWVLVILTLVGVPVAFVAAWRDALAED